VPVPTNVSNRLPRPAVLPTTSMRGSQPCWDDAGSKRVIPPKGEIKKERDRAERELAGLNAALAAFVCAYSGKKPKTKTAALPTRKRRKLSAASRPKMAAAQRAPWEKLSKGLRSVKLLLKGLHWKTHCRAFRMSFILANLQNGFFSKTKNFRPLLCIAKCENC